MSIASKLVEIDQRKQQIEEAGSFSEAVKKQINYRFRLDWNYYSNRMEGGTLTREETRSIMVGNINVDRKPVKDVMEMNGHDQVVREILRIGRGEKRLSERRIKEIHRAIIYEEDEEKARLIGRWKEEPNEIINYQNEKIDFCPPDQVAERMHELLNRTNAAIDQLARGKKDTSSSGLLHPVLIASDFHIDYLTIHPFYDGNGRTVRILTNLLLIAYGFPPVVITDEEKPVYYRYLSDIQTYSSNRDLFYGFFADQLIRSLQLVQDAIAGVDLTQEEDIEKELQLIEQQLKLKAEETPIKTPERVKDIIDHGLIPLFNKLRNELQPFERLFETIQISIGLDGKGMRRVPESDQIKVYYDDVLKQELKQLNCSLLFIELKGIAEKTHFRVEFKVEFRRDYYVMEDGVTIANKRKKYNQPLSEEEQNEWVGKIKNAFLGKLKGIANGK